MSKNQAPEKTPADKKPDGIEVLELDRPLDGEDRQPRSGGGKPLLVLLALFAVIVLGLVMLPDPISQPVDLDDTLPAPVAATTIPDRERISVGVIGLDTFRLQFEPSLEGYRSLAGPAYSNGAWWMIGNAAQPAILSSLDGVEWSVAGNFPTGEGRFVEVHDLISSEDALIAVGPEGTRDISVDMVEQIQVWRSPDGVTWIPEVVAAGLTFANSRVVANGHNLVVTASDAIGHNRLYHSSSFTLWEEISITFSTEEGIVRAPEGGLMLSTPEGAVLTSAFGVNWSRTQAIDRGFYTQWRDRVVGTYSRSGQPQMRVIGAEDIELIELPMALDGCPIHGGLTGLLAICPNPSGNSFDFFLSEDGLVWIRSELAMFTDELTYEGDTDRGFLVSAAGIHETLVVARVSFP